MFATTEYDQRRSDIISLLTDRIIVLNTVSGGATIFPGDCSLARGRGHTVQPPDEWDRQTNESQHRFMPLPVPYRGAGT